VRRNGGKTFHLRYTDARGKQRQLKLADACDVSLEKARSLADKCRARVAMGESPVEQKREVRATPRFADFIEDRYAPYARAAKRSWPTDETLLKCHLLPRFGRRFMDEVTRFDVAKMVADMQKSYKPSSINRVLVLLAFIYAQAIRWETPGLVKNPAAGVKPLKDNFRRERFLSVEEARSLFDAVCKSDNGLLRPIIGMLLLTGARKRELLDATWKDFDIARRLWRIPMSKSGHARHVPLSDGAVQLLSEVPRLPGVETVFANPQTGKPFASITSAWDTARKRAGLHDVRLHDLRHSFASLLVNQGRTLFEVQQILGHSQPRTTMRYAHLRNDTLVDAANAAGNAVGAAMGIVHAPTVVAIQNDQPGG